MGTSGQVLTSNGVGAAPTFQVAAGGGLTFAKVVKGVDETVNNSTTLQNDDDLLFSASANLEYSGFVLMFLDSTTVADIKYAFSLPTDASGVTYGAIALDANTPSDSINITTERQIATSGSDQAMYIPFRVTIVGTAGTVNFQWAQNTAQVSDTKCLLGSTIIVWEE